MKLTDTAIRGLKAREKPFKLSDGGGLHLLVQPNGARLWRLAYRFHGRQKQLALGAYPTVSLAKAREGRDAAKRLLADGHDPSLTKRREKLAARHAGAATFGKIARDWLETKRVTLLPVYGVQLERRLEADLLPALGHRPIADIDAPELLSALRKVETRGVPEQARRLRQMMGQVFRYAIASGLTRHDPTSGLRGALQPQGLPKHHRMLPLAELPQFLLALDAYDREGGDPRTRLALRLTLLCLTRTGETRLAAWSEFEHLDGAVPLWRIPAPRMKAKREHLIPLSRQAVALLKELRELPGAESSPFLFPAPSKQGVMSNNTMLYAVYRMGWHKRMTVHGLRSLASTVLNEQDWPSDWIELALAHGDNNEVRRAYNHAKHLQGRRDMLQHWADWLDQVQDSGKAVVATREAAE